MSLATYDDVNLLLRLYDLKREEKMYLEYLTRVNPGTAAVRLE